MADTAGTNYYIGQTFTVRTALGGASPANDATITIASENNGGATKGVTATANISEPAQSVNRFWVEWQVLTHTLVLSATFPI